MDIRKWYFINICYEKGRFNFGLLTLFIVAFLGFYGWDYLFAYIGFKNTLFLSSWRSCITKSLRKNRILIDVKEKEIYVFAPKKSYITELLSRVTL